MPDGTKPTTISEARDVLAAQNHARARALGLDHLALAVVARHGTAEERAARKAQEEADRERNAAEWAAMAEERRLRKAAQRAAARAAREARDRQRRAEEARMREEIRQRQRAREKAAERKAAEKLATKNDRDKKRAEREAAWAYARSPEGRAAAYARKCAQQDEKRADDKAEADREMLLALYDHPATGRFLRLVNAGRWEPEMNLPAWLDAAEMIPEDLRQFALHVRAEFDPLHSVAVKIANLGGDTLEQIGRLYGLTRERIRQIEDDGIRELRKLGFVREMRAHLESEPGHIPGVRDRRVA